jgi:hypothetical protein
MRTFVVTIAIAVGVLAVPGMAGAAPPPNGANCVGVADSGGAQAGGFGQVVSGIARSGAGAIADSLEAFVSRNCDRTGP